MNGKVLGYVLLGVGAYFVFRREKGSALSALGAPPDVHRQEASGDMGSMSRLVAETEGHVSAGRCKAALASAGKAAVAAGKVERNLEYVEGSVRAGYKRLNERRMASRDAFAARCMG